MVFGTVFELSLTFVQFFASMTQIPSFSVPDEWKYVSVVNLNVLFLRDLFPSLKDFRMFFTVICVIVPVILVLLGLYCLNSIVTMFWYVSLLTGVSLVVAAILALSLKAQLKLSYSDDTMKNILLVGVVLVTAMLLFAIAAAAVRYFRKRALEKAGGVQPITLARVLDAETEGFPVIATLKRIVIIMVAIFIAVAALGLNAFGNVFQLSSDYSTIQFGLGVAAILVALITIVWMGVGFVQAGRRLQWKVYGELEKQFMRLLLITMSLLYIPVGAGVFVLFNCSSHKCPPGTFFAKDGSWLPTNGTSSACIPCSLNSDQVCGARNTVCAGLTSEQRLQVDPLINCNDLVLFNYAAIVIVIMYMVGVPLMFFNLVRIVTARLLEEFPVKLPKDEDPDDEAALWKAKVQTSANSARFLYQPFIPELKYTRLYQLLQKLLVVFTSVFVIDIGVNPVYVALGASGLIHIASLVWLAVRRPFLHRFENGIALVMEVALLFSIIITLCITSNIPIPPGVFWTITAVNGLLPIVAVAISFVLEWTSKKSREEEEEQEEKEELEREMEKRAQEEADEALAAKVHQEENGALPPTATDLNSSATDTLKRSRAEAAREAVEARRREERLDLHTRQADCDHLINVAVKSRLNLFLMAMGMLGFTALGLCIVGFFARASSYPTRWDHDYASLTLELAGYDSWSNFTSHCCCVGSWGDPTTTSNRIVEQWTCDNGAVKERIRSTIVQQSGVPVEISGLAIRGVCAINFEPGCVLLTGGAVESLTNADSVETQVAPYCSTGATAVSAYALTYLW